MFERKGSSFIITKVYDDVEACTKDWGGLTRSASFRTKEFTYDPNTFLYYRARAITAEQTNNNGDYFPLSEIKAAYPTFIGKGVYYNHDNDSPDKAFGVILDAELIQDNPAYVEILCALDKELTEQKRPGLIRRVATGIACSTSMSCLSARAVCGICMNEARTMEQLCSHMNPDSLHYIKGKRIDASEKLAYEINYDLTFTEDSIVDNPADHTARVFEVWSADKTASRVSQDDIASALNRLGGLLQDFSKMCAR